MTDERLQIWLGFWKWFLSAIVITGGIAWATTIINAKHKDTELAIKVNQEEKEYLTSFLERAMDDNLEKRRRFAQYFANVTTSGDYKSGWINYLAAVEKELESVKAEKEELESGLSAISGQELEQARERIQMLRTELVRSSASMTRRLEHYSLNTIETLTSYKLQCPEKAVRTVWSETVSNSALPDFPASAYYVTYGCHDVDGNDVGRFVSWYPSGAIIQEGEVTGKITLYYPNGNKAAEGVMVGLSYLNRKLWNIDGTPRE